MGILFTLLIGCSANHQVVWDDAGEGDTPDDISITMFSSGTATDGRALLEMPHAAGSSLEMRVEASGGGSAAGWSVDSLNADICQVVAGESDDVGALAVTLYFRRQGATDLFVTDAAGEILDWEPVEVRDPAGIVAIPYEVLVVGEALPVDTLHVLPGTEATVAVSWSSTDGEVLTGAGLLAVGAEGDGLDVEAVDTMAAGGFDGFDLSVAAGADPGEGSVAIAAGGMEVMDLPVRIHDPDEVSGVTLVAQLSGETSGRVRAAVQAGETTLIGVPVTWIDDGLEVGVGTWVEFEGGDDAGDPADAYELTACYADQCSTVMVPGHVVATHDATAPTAAGCGCAHGGAGAGWLGLLAGAVALGRRRAERHTA